MRATKFDFVKAHIPNSIFIGILGNFAPWVGSMVGLNEQMLCEYVEWLAAKRMRSVGLPTKYKSGTNPLPWTQRWIAGSEVQVAPQETEISSYIVGGVKKDATAETFQGFSL